jgi:hypothetical protein
MQAQVAPMVAASSQECQMAQNELVTARVMAARLSKTLGRPITDKAVRSWVRDNLAAHDKTKHPEYQAHVYNADDVRRITAGFAKRTPNARVQAQAKVARKSAVKRTVKPAVKPATNETAQS